MSDSTRPGARDTSLAVVSVVAVLCLVLGGLGGFLIAHYGVDGSSSSTVTTPDPETVTCGAFANLTAQQKRTILDKLNEEDDTHVSMSLLDTGCPGLVANADDPVSGAVYNLGN